MSTVILQSAGAFIGSLFGPVGSAIGSALGAMAGYAIDRSLLMSTQRIEGPRLATMRPFSAEEGTPLARVYGTVRIGGNIIWATRFQERRKTERQGGKGGGPKVTTYSYFANVALALCEGEIGCVRRVWADGRELDLGEVTLRVYRGDEDQPVDPLIAARQGDGNAPAYRGVAYVVFQRFPIGDYGNRIPQFQFEVIRPVGRLNRQIRSVALLPGSTEFGLLPRPVTRKSRPGVTETSNHNVLHASCDLVASLDELQALCPALEEVAIVTAWFGDDLRAGTCTLRPKVTDSGQTGWNENWRVSGLSRGAATVVSKVDGASSYGGTPSDRSLVECIGEIRRRGLKVALYPFVMMDVPPNNALPDPYGGGASQPAFPWRGRITCAPAPGQPGSADGTAAARAQVAAFCGAAEPVHFPVSGGNVGFSGPSSDWGYRRFVLHHARLAALAGGVDAFILGSELRGLTTLRDGDGAFPFVEALCRLAADARAMLGPGTDITYGADWSEYFGHQPADGSGDVLFHLDPLWAHPAVSSVGIDNYMPLSDWRDGDYAGGNPDGFRGPYDRDGLRGQIAAGEGFDWYYADAAARQNRQRTPITDGTHGKPWVYRPKDIRAWWENRHFDRIGGAEAEEPTPWQPRAKPVRFTELGCPAVDKGPNQPNVFPDAKSSENALPHFSSGGRSDMAQARFLAAHFDRWDPESPGFEPGANPVSPVYGGRMVDPAHICVWAWDARPFPAFPSYGDIWRDGDNWHRGHWLNGRLSTALAGELFMAVLADHGLSGADETQGSHSIAGYVVDRPLTARAALEPLVDLAGIAVLDHDGVIELRDELAPGRPSVSVDELVVPESGEVIERTRTPGRDMPREVELTFVDPFRDYQLATARLRQPDGEGGSEAFPFAGCLEAGAAEALLADWMQRKRSARETAGFSVPASRTDIVPGALVLLPEAAGGGEFLVTEVETGLARAARARRIARAVPTPWRSGRMAAAKPRSGVLGQPHVLFLDLPMLPGAQAAHEQFRIAAFASPWRSQIVYSSPEEEGYAHVATVPLPAVIGEAVSASAGFFEGRYDHIGAMTVALYDGALSSVSTAALLNGANTAAVRADNGEWEVFQFGQAEEILPSVWELTLLLRAQCGTGDAAAAGISPGAPFVLLDEAVVRAGLAPEQAGLPLNWRIGPSGKDFAGPYFVDLQMAGGVRAQLPLSPVHLRCAAVPGGNLSLNWVRRGRIDADSWLGEDIPLGEESERYRIEVALAGGGGALRTAETPTPQWTYPAALQALDFPSRPAAVVFTVRQISPSAGAGLPARRTFTLI